MDNEFFAKRECLGCGEEVFPRELYCGSCGHALHDAPEAILLPAEAARFRICAGFFLDGFAIALLVGFQFWGVPILYLLILASVGFIIYRMIGRAQGRQTLGQAVFHTLTVSRQAGPASFEYSARRTLGEFWMLPMSLFGGHRWLRALDEFSVTYEVRLD